MKWFLYIVKATDGSLYTGITTDVSKRIIVHNNKRGAKSLKGKLPVILAYREQYINRSQASMREAEIKKLSREKKLQLVSSLI